MENVNNIIETIRIKGGTIYVNVFMATGKDGEFYVNISPSIHVSGYGRTPEDAEKSFEENMKLFCEDLMSLPKEKRDHQLISLGFSRSKLKTKNFSKTYIDKDGALQNFEPGTIKTSMLTETF
jgi:hypothetical protein